MVKSYYYLVNAITFYRLMAVLILSFLMLSHQLYLFKWFLAMSFFSDLIDGFLARRYHVCSVFGAKLDSIADDGTVLAAFLGLLSFRYPFLKEHIVLFLLLFGLYVIQVVMALYKFGKLTSFHSYSAKIAAMSQGIFFILLFFLPVPMDIIFYISCFFTLINLLEEIALVAMLPAWKANVKGVYWVLKNRDSVRD